MKQKMGFVFVPLILLFGCGSQDLTNYKEGQDKIGVGYLVVSQDGKQIAHFGRAEERKDLLLKGILPTGAGIVKVVNPSLETVFYWQHPRLSPQCAVFDPLGEYLVIGCASNEISAVEQNPGTLIVVNLKSKKKVFETTAGKLFNSASFSTDGRFLAISCYDFNQQGFVRLFSFPTMKEVGKSKPERGNLIQSIGFCDGNQRITISSFMGMVQFLDVPSLKQVGVLEIKGEKLVGQMRSLLNKGFFIVPGNKKCYVIDPRKMELVRSVELHSGGFSRFDIIPKTSLVISSGADQVKNENLYYGTCKVRDILHNGKVQEWESSIGPFALLPDGRRMVVAEEAHLQIRDIQSVLPKIQGLSAPNK